MANAIFILGFQFIDRFRNGSCVGADSAELAPGLSVLPALQKRNGCAIYLLRSSLRLIEPGKPWQNGVNESFNGKFRDECLSLEWFRSRTEAKIVIQLWRHHYNTVRPQLSLRYQTPVEFAAKFKEQASASPHATSRDAPRYGGLRAPARCITAS